MSLSSDALLDLDLN